MKKIKRIMGAMFAAALLSVPFAADAQTNNQNAMMRDSRMMRNSAMRLETWTDRFEDSLGEAFDNNRVDNTDAEDEVLALVKGFGYATDRFSERVEDNEVIAPDVERLLSRALLIEGAMSKLPASRNANNDWMQIKEELNRIAQAYNVKWVWTLEANPYWKTAAVEPIFDRLDSRSDEFLNSLKYALDFSRINGTKLEDEAIELARRFEDNMDMLETRADKAGSVTTADMDKVLAQGMVLEAFLRTHNLSSRVMRDWAQVKTSLRELAMRSNTTWTWTVKPMATTPATR
ncbi:MAG TPA: hypothetical protein VNI84_13570 [Pyrinomonadaceae bacterium]|nr:hypothetical protein [Pyrinomonadaceae bacterium]